MDENVTVDKAISKGHKMVIYPIIVIVSGTFGLTFYLVTNKIIPIWGFSVWIFLAFIFAWLWWGFIITKWRIWAFDKVRNVHELKKRAILEKLIWADNSIIEMTETRTTKDKEKLNSLRNKFKQDDFFYDDLSVPNETVIYYSKGKNFVIMTFMLGVLGIGIYFLLKRDDYFFSSIFIIYGAYFGYKTYKAATNTEPQIIINDKGIKTISSGFNSWNDIENEEVISKGNGKNTDYYLSYNYPEGVEHLLIDSYNTDIRSLYKLLILYRGRSKKKTTNR